MKPLSSSLSTPKPSPSPASRGASRWLLLPIAIVVAFLVGRGFSAFGPLAATQNQVAVAPATKRARELNFRVVASIPHDRAAFTEGLLWDDGGFYESNGMEKHSNLRRIQYPSGKVLSQIQMAPELFGEGLTLWRDQLIQLTYQTQRGFVYDRKTFRKVREWNYQGEGWGLTHDDRHLIMSNGSDILTYRDPDSFAIVRQLSVTLNGVPQRNLNELEWIGGRIWANIWQTDSVVVIDPTDGHIESYLNCAGLLPAAERTGREDVLNGIAYDEKTKRIWLTGKYWPKIYEIKLEN